MRAVLYPRVSSDIQRGNYSIPSQIKDMIAYANEHGYTIVGDRFVDPVTGRDTEKVPGAIPAYVDDYTSTESSRPVLDECEEFLKSVGFDVLIAHSVDRLARDPYIRRGIEIRMASLGARVEYVLGNYDESAYGEVRKDMDATFAKWENAVRVERSNRGKKRKAEMGKFVSGFCPYGYRVDDNEIGGLVPYEPEAEIVRMIFNLYVVEKVSLNQIARKIVGMGIKTARENYNWTASSISHILKYTAYAGYIYYNKSVREKKKQIKRDKSEWIKIYCTPIVDPEMFEAAQEILKYNKEYKRKHPKRFYLLAGMVFCTACERPYSACTLNPGVRRSFPQQGYRHRINQGHCLSRMISSNILEPKVWEKVTEVLLNPSSLRKGYKKMIAEEEKKQERQLRHLEILKAGIEKFNSKRSRLQKTYLDPDIGMSKDEYLTERNLIDDQIITANEDIEKIEKDLKKVPTEEDLQSLEEMAGRIVEALGNNLDICAADKRMVMEMLNIKVMISPERKMTVEGWFSSDGLSLTSWI